MSAVALPRLYFAGHNYWNPSTFNNDDNLPTYDAANVRLNWPYLYTQGVHGPEQFRRWAITTTYDAANDEYLPPAEWNFYGDMSCGFVTPDVPAIEDPAHFDRPAGGTAITGWSPPGGGWKAADGGWQSAQVQLDPGGSQTKMCDVNPVAFWSTQLFADRFQVGSAGSVGFAGAVGHRMCSRFPNLQNNFDGTKQLIIAGSMIAVWQICLPKAGITLFEPDPVGQALARALDRPGVAGLMVRFSSYETLYFNGAPFRAIHGSEGQRLSKRMELMAELYQQYAAERAAFEAGERTDAPAQPVNRAYSKARGWIGLWREGELQSAPGGRLLRAHDPFGGRAAPTPVPSNLKLPDGKTPSGLPLGPATVEAHFAPAGAADGSDGMNDAMHDDILDAIEAAPASLNVTRITMDAAVTFPRLALDGPLAEYGAVALELDGFGTVATLKPSDYVDAVDRKAGLIDLVPASPLTAAQWFGGDLSLRVLAGSQSPVDALQEQALTAATDDRGVYCEQPRRGEPPARLTVRVSHRGRAPVPGTRLLIAQYDAGWTRCGTEKGSAPIVALTDSTGARGTEVLLTAVRPVGPRFGHAVVGVEAIMPGIPNLAFLPLAPGTPTPTLVPALGATDVVDAQYTVARALPFHDQLAVAYAQWLKTSPDAAQADARVFHDVFMVWALMYPAMDFLRDPQVFKAWRGPIMDVTDPKRWSSPKYMPVNRSMSAGQRRILELWDAYQSGRPVGLDVGLRKRTRDV